MEHQKKPQIYMDYAAATPLRTEVLEAMLPYMQEDSLYANPSGVHTMGHNARRAIDDARAVVAQAIHASPQELVFTAGGTESVSLALCGAVHASGRSNGNIVITAIEHAAVLETAHALEKAGYELRIVKPEKNGIVSPRAVLDSVDEATILVSVMMANNEIGTIQPVAEIVQAVHAAYPDVLVHTDACQATGYLTIDVKQLGVDLLSINSSKIYGPKGVGSLYIRRGVKIQPLVYGGGQEHGLRPGTENVAGIVGFAKAVELIQDEQQTEVPRLQKLRDTLMDSLRDSIDGVIVNGDTQNRLPNNVHVLIAGIDGEALLFSLDQAGVYASLGSACAAGSVEPSHVLLALGHNHDDARRSLRLTLGRYTTDEEIQEAAAIIAQHVHRLRS